MPDPVWYKSLYWRIAFGFVAMLGALLVAQVLVFVWLTDRVVGWAAQSPEELVSSVASDLSTALMRNTGLPLDTYVRDEFSHIYRPFVVVMVDGRAASNRPSGLPPGYLRAVQMRLRRGESLNAVDPRDGGRGGRGGRDRGFDRRREPFDSAQGRPFDPAGVGPPTQVGAGSTAGPVGHLRQDATDRLKPVPRTDLANRRGAQRALPSFSPPRTARPAHRSDSSSSRSTRRRCSWPYESLGRR